MAKKIDGGGLRYNGGKDRWDLLPIDAVGQIVKVLTAGAKKYEPRNWERGMKFSICLGSLLRHIAKRALGEVYDKETGLPHMACAGCNVLFLLAYDIRGMQRLDDMEPFARKKRS